MSDERKLLILDLDETLIHANEVSLTYEPSFRYDQYFVYQRPGLALFLTDISKHYQLAIWSSADDRYVEEILSFITPQGLSWVFTWGRSKCSWKRDYVFDTYCFEKRLDKLKRKGFRMEQTLIVDDSPEKARANYGNAVYIHPFTGDPADNELLHLYQYLLDIKDVGNVRSIEKRGWRNRNQDQVRGA